MGGRLKSVTGELHVIGAEAQDIDLFAAYGFSGELVPVMDADGALDINVLWDNMVAKPVQPTSTAATDVVDWDTDGPAQTGPDVEPGEVDMKDITGLLDVNKALFQPRIEWMSFAKGAPVSVAAGTPDTYTPRSYKTFQSRRVLKADMPSYALLAVSSPSLDNEQTTKTIINTAANWGVLENLRSIMQDFWRINTGMIEATAESPYDVASARIADLVSPDMINPATTLVAPQAFTVMCHCTWLLEMPDSQVSGVIAAQNE